MPTDAWRLVLTGGGTGGHIYPALAIAEAARRRWRGLEVLFIGARGGMEERLVPAAGWAFEGLPVRGLVRKRPLEALAALAALPAAEARALQLLRAFRPRAVVGTGGYAAAPVGVAAALLRIPLLLQEQNAVPGVTNRLLARLAAAVALPFPESARRFPRGCRTFVAGNPVRPEVGAVSPAEGRRRLGLPAAGPVVLCMAGSRGSATFVRLLAGWLPRWRAGTLLFVSGEAHHRSALAVLAAYDRAAPEGPAATALPAPAAATAAVGTGGGRPASTGAEPAPADGCAGRVVCVPYLVAVAEALAAADLVVCRAGALTLAELAAAGRPAVLIPSPHVTHRHQEANARVFARAGAAVVLREEGLDGRRLAAVVDDLLGRPSALRSMAAAASALARPRALETIVERLGRIAGIGAT